jgi:hypothetical protein
MHDQQSGQSLHSSFLTCVREKINLLMRRSCNNHHFVKVRTVGLGIPQKPSRLSQRSASLPDSRRDIEKDVD